MEKHEVRWQKDFADLVGITPVQLSDVLNGRYRCSVKIARQIEAAVGGEITAEELVMIDPLHKRKPARKAKRRARRARRAARAR